MNEGLSERNRQDAAWQRTWNRLASRGDVAREVPHERPAVAADATEEREDGAGVRVAIVLVRYRDDSRVRF